MSAFFGRKSTSTANTKRAVSRLMMTSALVAAGTLVLSTSAMAAPWEDMTGPGFDKTSAGNTTNIKANTVNGKASGTGNLDILAGETVNIDAKLFVARDNHDTIKTSILGNLNSNGTVVLIDKNGVMFGKDSRVDVGSLIATTGDLTSANPLGDADTPLLFSNFGTGEIVNGGSIAASGLVAFVAPTVKNNGIINAKLGRVALAADGTAATIDLYGDGLVEFATSPVASADAKYLSENTGDITGGKIQMTAAAAKNVADSIVNMQGVLIANSAVENAKGEIVLSAGTVKLGSASARKPSVSGNTKINATQLELGLTVDGAISGSAKEVNILTNKAKIAQGLEVVASKGTVYVSAGTYNEHLVMDKDGVTLKSTADAVINPNSPGVEITANNVTVDGLTFENALGFDGYGIFVNGGNNATLTNNIIRNTAQSGIYVLGASGVTISNNNIGATAGAGNIGTDGIHLLNVNGAVITGNIIANTTSPADEIGSGVYVQNSNNATISGNTIHDVKWDGVKIKDGSGSTVSGNTIYNTVRAAVSASYTTNVKILNNTANNLGMWGVWSTHNNGVTVNGNTLNTTKSYGVLSDYDTNIVLNENNIDKTNRNAVQVQNTSGTVEIKNNKIGLVGGTKNINGDGINLYKANGAVVSGNVIGNTASTGDEIGSGIYSRISDNVVISGNSIYKTGWDGVKVKGGNNVLVDSNITSNLARSSVAASGTTNTTISNNTGTYMGQWGIWTSLNDNIQILGNKVSTANRTGILSYQDTGVTIDDNTVSNTKRDGVRIQESSSAKVTNNKIGSTVVGNNIFGDGVYVYGSDGAIITGNIIANVASIADEMGSGVYAQNSDNAVISGNMISNVGWDGVKVKTGDNYLIEQNIISNTGRSAVSASYTTNSLISQNTGNNMGMWGVWSEHNQGLEISENTLNTTKSYGISSDRDTDTLIHKNTVLNTNRDGIRVTNTGGTIDITDNNVGATGGAKNIKGDGIHLYNTNGAQVTGNTISNTASTGDEIGSGIYAQKSDDVVISKNTISKTGWDAVKVKNGNNYLVSENTGTNLARSVVAVSETTNSVVFKNTGTKMSQWGIWSSLNENVLIDSNNITTSARTGILSYLDNDVEITTNIINGAKRDGIRVQEGSGVVYVGGNTILNSGDNGVYIGLYHASSSEGSEGEKSALVEGLADGIYVNDNIITNAGINGVFVEHSTSPTIEIINNDIQNTNNGIALVDTDGGITVNENDIRDSRLNGIYANDVNRGLDTFGEGAPAYQVTIFDNDIDNSAANGIELNEVGGVVTIDTNRITNSGTNGILVYNSAAESEGSSEQLFALLESGYKNPIELHIVDNTVLNGTSGEGSGEGEGSSNGFAAVNVDVSGDGYVELSGNRLGNNFEYGLVAYSGLIDLTGAANTIQNTNIGMGFYPASAVPETDSSEYFNELANKLSLVDNTIGTTAFIDQSQLFVDLGYGAMFAPGTPTLLDGNNATYTLGGVTIAPALSGGFVTASELATLEAYINHYNDEQNRGLFFFSPFPTVSGITINQKDVLRNVFDIPVPNIVGGNLTITGLPSVGLPTGAAPTAPFNPSLIEPAAGDESGSTAGTVANIQPAAGGDTACWADATVSLGQGTPVTFNFGASGTALLQDAVNCGSTQGQPTGQAL